MNFEVWTCTEYKISAFSFNFFSVPFLLLFLPHSFSFAGHLIGLISVGKVFGKAFRILQFDERKFRWVQNLYFRGNFYGNVTPLPHYLPFSPASLTELCSFWYDVKDLFTLVKLTDKVVPDR